MAAPNYRQLAAKYQAVDWAVVAALAVADVIMNTAVMPHCRSFEWSDASISYAMKPDTFPLYTLVLMVIAVPAFYAVFTLYCVAPLRKMLGEPLTLCTADGSEGDVAIISDTNSATSAAALDTRDRGRPRVAADRPRVHAMKCGTGPVYPWIKAHLWALVLDQFTVDMMKLYAGRLRPDFLARMARAGFTAATTTGKDPRTDVSYFCELMREHHELREGRLSFPSGHSGTSCAIFTVMTFYLFAHLRPLARRGSFARLLLSLSPMLVPMFCAVSRTRDNKHNFSDIVAGSCIGVAAAVLVIATVFRQAGGPLALYLARCDSDIEYLKQQRPPRRSAAAVDYHSVGSAMEMRGGVGAAAPAEPSNGSMTVVVQVGGEGSGGEEAVSSTSAGTGSGGWFVVLVGERELNEDPAAVPWL